MEKNNVTAVEWLIEKITESGHLWLTDKPYGMDELDLIIEAAKQIEKEQIMDDFMAGQWAWKEHLDGKDKKDPAEYYNETYGK